MGFFGKETEFPHFRSGGRKNDFTIPRRFGIRNGEVFVPGFGNNVEFTGDRSILNRLEGVAMSMAPNKGCCIAVVTRIIIKSLRGAGLDINVSLNLGSFIVASSGSECSSGGFVGGCSGGLTAVRGRLSHGGGKDNS